jgi:hypothetical protein
MINWLIMMGWDWHLRIAAMTGLLLVPRANESGEPWWWWCRLGITCDLSTRACWQSYQQRHVERVGGMDEGVIILHIQYLWYVNRSFYAVKSYDLGPLALLPTRRKVCCKFLSSLKVLHLSRVLKPSPLSPVASTLTTTPPRWLQ